MEKMENSLTNSCSRRNSETPATKSNLLLECVSSDSIHFPLLSLSSLSVSHNSREWEANKKTSSHHVVSDDLRVGKKLEKWKPSAMSFVLSVEGCECEKELK